MNLGKSLNIGTYAGIPVKLHWTFGLMIFFVGYIASMHRLSPSAIIGFTLLVLCVFFCVVLHEYGHAMAARYYGIKTYDIILSPIGGLARLQRIPTRPLHELIVAFAGPAVNLVIAAALWIILRYIVDTSLLPSSEDFELLSRPSEFFKFIFIINISLFVFNLIPAFPMDGGRVLRALLAIKLNRVLATRIAMWIGRILAVGFLYIAFTANAVTWGLIGVFVYIMAGKEYQQVVYADKALTPIIDIMSRSYSVFSVDQSLDEIVHTYHSGSEKNFIIVNQEQKIVGAMPEQYIEQIIQDRKKYQFVSDLYSTRVAIVQAESTLKKVGNMMNENGIAICAVYQDGHQVGVIDRYVIKKFYMKKIKSRKKLNKES